jgi:hypothetical protein
VQVPFTFHDVVAHSCFFVVFVYNAANTS